MFGFWNVWRRAPICRGSRCRDRRAGDRRVLIENHGGVTQYSAERIGVRVSYGTVCIMGCGLELKQMTKERLVIAGRIDSVNLIRRGRP